jgi:SAM-dependent methyltransferase
MADEKTLAIYDARVSDYSRLTERTGIDPDLVRFMNHLHIGGFVLDLGCGPGVASQVLRQHGFRPDPVDASGEMVRFANENHALGARIGAFEDIDAIAAYDGVWANFSLLHAKRAEMPMHLAAIHKALKPGGIFHIGMKTGTGESRDKIGRFYTYYSHDELEKLLEEAGFAVLDRTIGEDSAGLSGEMSPWMTMLSKT